MRWKSRSNTGKSELLQDIVCLWLSGKAATAVGSHNKPTACMCGTGAGRSRLLVSTMVEGGWTTRARGSRERNGGTERGRAGPSCLSDPLDIAVAELVLISGGNIKYVAFQ
jgi:hypothetical protein